MPFTRTLLLLIIALAPLALFTANATEIKRPGQELGFTPHKALYEVELANSRSGSQIVNIAGHMYYEWSYDCDAWSSKHRFNVLYEYADSPAMRITSDFSNFEAFDGSTLDYSALRSQNGDQYEEIRGHAKSYIDKKGGADYNQPQGLQHELPAGALYPMMHTAKVIEAIQQNKKFFNAVVFDGSDDDGPVEINAFIGKSVDSSAGFKNTEGLALDMGLLKGPANKIQLAFFPQAQKEENADYEMSLVLNHNSVISDMHISYDDFSVRQKLIALEAISPDKIKNACQ